MENKKVCSKCGNNRFLVSEGQIWNGEFDEAGVFQCTDEEVTGIDSISCSKCGHECKDELDYNEINWN